MRRAQRVASGGARRARVLLLGVALCGGIGAAGCEGRTAESQGWLEAVEVPAFCTLGTTVRAVGRGLSGARVELRGPTATMRLEVASDAAVETLKPTPPGAAATGEGADSASSASFEARVVQVQGAAMAALEEACLLIDTEAGVGRGNCVALAQGASVGAFAPLSAPQPHELPQRLGGLFVWEVDATLGPALPKDDEGSVALWVEDLGGEVALPAGLTRLPSVEVALGRIHLSVAAGGWLGVAGGLRRLRCRVERTLAGAAPELGEWSDPVSLTLAAPAVVATAGTARAGEIAPIAVVGAPDDVAVEVELRGSWRSSLGDEIASWSDSPRRLPTLTSVASLPATMLAGEASAARLAYLPALRWAHDGWRALPDGAVFEGEARVVVGAWAGGWAAAGLTARRRQQTLVVAFGAGMAAGLWRYGLAHRRERIEARTLALVAAHFAAYAVDVRRDWPAHVVEANWVEVRGDDPNGAGLLGTEPSLGKDDGNWRHDEVIGGFCPDAWAAGYPAFGGVFVSSFLRFSPTLMPGGGATDARFDGLFAAFAPELGGHPAAPDETADAAAVEALAQLIAGTISHEFGHALGLASATDGYHHSGDQPRWRMDAGAARPFGERAALAPEGEEIWGPLDDAYLRAILPRE